MEDDKTLRYLEDLAARAERSDIYTYSGFLSPEEQDAFRRVHPFGPFRFEGGTDAADRCLLICGNEEELGYPPEPPIALLTIRPASEKFGEELSHRDVLGAVLHLGIERSLIGDILIRDKTVWLFCLESIADFLLGNVGQIRHTHVKLSRAESLQDVPAPVLVPLKLNVASERLDGILSAFCRLSRGKAVELIRSERVRIGARLATSPDTRLKEGDVLRVRGFGKAIYDGIEKETKKGRLYVALRQYQ